MSNRYTPDNQFILDNAGRKYAVNVPHPLPMPDGIEACSDLAAAHSAFGAGSPVIFGGPQAAWGMNGGPLKSDTHWLARAPLPPVPKPKTQEELDEDAANNFVIKGVHNDGELTLRGAFKAGAAYARKDSK